MTRGAAMCFALACTGCASRVAAPPARPALPAQSSPAAWRMTLTTFPAAPRQLDPTQFQVQILGSDGKPVVGASVSVSLSMPTMDMGQNTVTAQAGTAGTYAAQSRFTMPGDWQVTVQADKGALHQSKSFPVTVQQ